MPHLFIFISLIGGTQALLLFTFIVYIHTPNFQPSLKTGSSGIAPASQLTKLLVAIDISNMLSSYSFCLHNTTPNELLYGLALTALVYIYCQSAAAHSLNARILALFKRHPREIIFCDDFRPSHSSPYWV